MKAVEEAIKPRRFIRCGINQKDFAGISCEKNTRILREKIAEKCPPFVIGINNLKTCDNESAAQKNIFLKMTK